MLACLLYRSSDAVFRVMSKSAVHGRSCLDVILIVSRSSLGHLVVQKAWVATNIVFTVVRRTFMYMPFLLECLSGFMVCANEICVLLQMSFVPC